ncbi:hypothetical protein V1514DRAFT_5720 [Lipomyces japonicus]|uniref:uncharacterized protein n=1 Tax=Lipomyces japonicus TaxID=56871 RepID=UPI0034CD9B51
MAAAAVTATLNFFQPPEDPAEVPYNIAYDVPAGTPTRNFSSVQHEVTVTPITTATADSFSLDANGFEFDHRIHEFSDWHDDDKIVQTYYPAVIAAIKDRTGAADVVVFDHTIRNRHGNRNPVHIVHVDQTTESAAARVRLHRPDDADKLLTGRFQIINYWKPITGPVEEFPLAFGDASTTTDHDIVAVEHRYRDRTGATGQVKFNQSQKYYYRPGMTTNDAVLLKCYDSKPDVAKRTPHSAFADPSSPENPRPRESIEVRTLVFY